MHIEQESLSRETLQRRIERTFTVCVDVLRLAGMRQFSEPKFFRKAYNHWSALAFKLLYHLDKAIHRSMFDSRTGTFCYEITRKT